MGSADAASRARDDRDPPLEACARSPVTLPTLSRRCTVGADAANRSERRAPTQREVEGASRRDHRHLGAGLRATRLPRHGHRGAVHGQRSRQGRLLSLHRVEGGAARRDPRSGDGRGDARRRSRRRRRAGRRPRSSPCWATSCSTSSTAIPITSGSSSTSSRRSRPSAPSSSAGAGASTSDRVEAILQAGIDAGEFRDVDARLTALAWLGMHNYTYLWLKAGGRVSARDVAKPFADIFIRGIAQASCAAARRRPATLEPQEPAEGAADDRGPLVGGDVAELLRDQLAAAAERPFGVRVVVAPHDRRHAR